MVLFLYRALTDLAGPIVPRLLARREAAGKEDPARRGERLGVASAARPPGRLVWMHAASVGESLSVLPLIARLRARRPDTAILLTTGTVSATRLVAGRLPAGVIGQYPPLDRRAYVRRFLDHWRPDAAVWVESELWPNLLGGVSARGIPAALVNARMSERSFRRWRRLPAAVRPMIRAFDVILPASAEQARRFAALGAREIGPVGNLKLAVEPPPADAGALAALRRAVGDRPVWLAASTHDGEEAAVAAVHARLAARHDGLLTILAPRHPTRGDVVAAVLAGAGLTVARRSAGALPGPSTAVYLADTLGELGVLYRAAPIAFVGGSLVPHGGHNPIEPAALGAAVLYGPHMGNFADMTGPLEGAGAASVVADAEALAGGVDALLADPAERRRRAEAAAGVAMRRGDILDRAVEALARLWPGVDRPSAA